MPDYFLRTPRLGFRQWSINDLPLALDLWGDPEVSRFLGGPFSREAIEEKLTKEIATLSAHHIQYWPIFLLANNEHVGCTGLRPYKPQEQIYELGYHLRRQYWGMGLAEDAGRAVVNF
ncbi:MAG: GNAT family N-acetyltransferase, partial [Ignavibacteria bacterium 13_1_40CM_2_61_4]